MEQKQQIFNLYVSPFEWKNLSFFKARGVYKHTIILNHNHKTFQNVMIRWVLFIFSAGRAYIDIRDPAKK